MSPPDPRFDPQQRAALDARGVSVGLSAGAGCGKTHVLTERFLRHLDGPDRLGLHQVVALTFTEKAARELRDRVRRECRARLDRPGATDDREGWTAVLRGLEAARIGTFHSFCGQLLRRFAAQAGIDPSFGVLDAATAPRHRRRALDACTRLWLGVRDPDLIALAVDLGLDQVRATVAKLLESADPEELESWLAMEPGEVLDRWLEIRGSEVVPRLLDRLREEARPTLERLKSSVPVHPTMIARRAGLLERFADLGQSDDPASQVAEILEHARVQGTTSKAWSDPSVHEPIKKGFETIRARCDAILDALAFDPGATLDAIERGRRFGRLVRAVLDAYDGEKRREDRLDFADLQLRTRALLRGHPGVVATLSDEVRALLVDEFQDTDPVQSEIIGHLCGQELVRGRLFLVGDFKQSIYRFRGAKPELFQQLRERFPQEGQLVLGRNYRSVPEIIGFVNTLFDGRFPGGDHALVAHRPPTSDGPAVEFLWARDGEDPADNVEAGRRIEARWLARRIAARLREGWPIWDKATNSRRDARPGDVAFLMRTLNDSAPYEAALTDEGIDYHLAGGAAFYGRQEILDVSNLLAVVEDPLDTLALAATVRGPFGCVSDDGLFWLATGTGDGLVAGFEAWSRLPGLSRTDRERAGRLHGLIDRLRAAKDRRPVAELLDLALDESGFEAALMAEPLGDRKRANVRKLVGRARRFDVESGLSLADFVDQLKVDLREVPREEEASTTDEDAEAVQFITIHASKGKEFPIVVLPDLNKDRNRSTSPAVFRPGLGLITSPSSEFDPDRDGDSSQSLGRIIDRHIESRADDEEAERLFYVATTRAQDALILASALAPGDKAKSVAMSLLDSRFDRMTGRPLDIRVASPPAVRVITDAPPPFGGTGRRRPPRRYLAVAAAIERAGTALPDEPPNGRPCPPDLDLDAVGLDSPHERRQLDLLRATLATLDDFDPLALESQVRRAARMRGMLTTGRTEAVVARLLVDFLNSEPGRLFRANPSAAREGRWAVAWPPEGECPTVYRGTTDLACRSDSGAGAYVVVAGEGDGASLAAARVKLRLSPQALGDGQTPARGWVVRFGETIRVESVARIDARSIGRDLDALYEAMASQAVEAR